ncbi:MCE family protein [Actinocorallia lasiicapitis]
MALKSLRDVNQRIVAFVAVGLISSLVGFAFLYGQVGLFQGGYDVTGVFADSGGLKVKDDVRQAGIKVGTVRSIDPDFAHGKVNITFRVDDGIKLGPQTRADIQLANLLGGRYIKLTGPVQRPYLNTLSEAKRRIPVERTGVPYTVVEALNTTTSGLGTLDVKSITKILNESEKLKTPTPENLNKLLTNVSALNAALNEKSPQFQRLLANAKQLTGTLATKNKDLTRLIEAARTLLRTLSDHRDELSKAFGDGSRVVGALADVVDKRAGDLDSLLANLHTLTQRLEPNMAALNVDLSLLGPAFEGFGSAGDTGNLTGMITGLGPINSPNKILPPEARP